MPVNDSTVAEKPPEGKGGAPPIERMARALAAEADCSARSYMSINSAGKMTHESRKLYVCWCLRWLEAAVDGARPLQKAMEDLETRDALGLPGFHGRYDGFFRPFVEAEFGGAS